MEINTEIVELAQKIIDMGILRPNICEGEESEIKKWGVGSQDDDIVDAYMSKHRFDVDTCLLEIRIFEESTKKRYMFARQMKQKI